jgi:hypothetical protein
MSSPIYMIRSPAQTLLHSLLLPEKRNVVVLAIEGAVTTVIRSQPGEVLQPGGVLPFKMGQRLTYRQLVDVLIVGRTVITL